MSLRQHGLTWLSAIAFGLFSGLAQAALPAFDAIVDAASPSVVNISATAKSRPAQIASGDDIQELLRRFYGLEAQPQQPRTRQSFGSGFIISSDGYVLTNNHVIDQADKVTVRLSDRREVEAKVIGTDPRTDLALLKVNEGGSFPFVQLATAKPRIGDWVLAVGNPFGLGGTVTAGIVSARNRDINAGPYDDFLQIDAAINRGNSGGPVFDESGKVIGINTAIYSPNGGSVGIGFSIPANIATKVVAQLKESGSISRGWLGVEIQPLTPEIAEALGMDKPEGALVARVLPGSPAGDAGLERGDVVVQIDGQPVKDARDLTRKVGDLQPGDRVGLTVRRQGDQKDIRIRLGERPQDLAANQQGDHADQGAGVAVDALGVRLAPIDDGLRQRLGIDDSVKGVAVVDMLPPKGDDKRPHAGPGPELRPGDVIEQVAGTAVDRPSQVTALIDEARARKRDHILLLVARGNESRFVAVEIK